MAESAPRSSILNINIKDKNSLYMAYMPFVNNGGLFIPTNRQYEIGQEIFVLLKLVDEQQPVPISGKVVWKTPAGSQNNQVQGIGIQFMEEDGMVARDKIETHLAGALGSDRPTYTM